MARRMQCLKCDDELRVKGQRWGRLCFNAYMRKWRPKYRELSRRAQLQSRCRAYTNVLVARGVLKRKPCAKCGARKVQAHHPDYTKPRQVRWLCVRHHRAWHRRQEALATRSETR